MTGDVFTIDAATNRITAKNGVGMTYDAAGNQTYDATGNRWFDGENRMHKATQGGTTSHYVYDADGKRVRRIIGSTETWMVYGIDGELVGEYAAAALATSPQKEYGYRSGQMLIAAETSPLKITWLVTDHLGTPRMNIRGTGTDGGSLASVTRHDYLPFGEDLIAGIRVNGGSGQHGYEPPPDGVRQKFTGYERDGETGLDYVMARMYANAQGRFTGVDSGMFTVADPQNFNRYSHTQNNPLKFIDPSGKNIELTGNDAQAFVDYLEKNTGLKLKYKVNNGVITITGSTKDKNFKGNVNKAFADVVSKVAGASGTAKFHVDSGISANGNQQGEVVFVDDNAAAYNSAKIGADGNMIIRPANINMVSVNSIDSQASELALGLVGHALIEGLKMRERGANYEVGDTVAGTATGAHPDGLDVERKILGQQNRRYQPNRGNTTNDPISFVYTNIQYDIVIKTGGAASVTKVSPPTIKRPQK